MILKVVGAALVIVSCGGFGFYIVLAHRKQVDELKQLLAALDYISCELHYHLTPLPELCKRVAYRSNGNIKTAFERLSKELEKQISPNVSSCMQAVLSGIKELPQITKRCLMNLGNSLGLFELEGQIKGVESARIECARELKQLSHNDQLRLRSYQTLALCAGAALAILFI